MTTNMHNAPQTIKFPNTTSIDIALGLKHCNNNHPLYFKVLNNFVKRYQSINLNEIPAEDLSRTLHSLKGLSATLGMTTLSQIIYELEISFDKIKINSFSQELYRVTESILNNK